MAKFTNVLTDDLMKDFNKIYNNTEKIFGEMTKAGAEVAMNNMKAKAPLPALKSHIRLTKQYKTPSDGGINTKVVFSGYIPFSGNRTLFTRSGGNGKKYSTTAGVPADFLAILYEYGRSGAPFPKRPFFRSAFNKGQIEQAMLKAQKKASGGLLDE